MKKNLSYLPCNFIVVHSKFQIDFRKKKNGKVFKIVLKILKRYGQKTVY